MELYLSTMADIIYDETATEWPFPYENKMNTVSLALPGGFGLELTEYTRSENLGNDFAQTDLIVRKKLSAVPKAILHAPYNEMFPCAFDDGIKQLAWDRFERAVEIALGYGIKKIVFHTGYLFYLYYPAWFVPQTAIFWNKFLKTHPGDYEVCLENVYEETPDIQYDLIQRIKDPRARLCLDIGHANCMGGPPVREWIKKLAPYLSHYHIHDNMGPPHDYHYALGKGNMPLEEILSLARELTPKATYTLETMDQVTSLDWLKAHDFLP